MHPGTRNVWPGTSVSDLLMCRVEVLFVRVLCVQFCLLVIDLTNYSYVISLLFRLPVNSRSEPQLDTGARVGSLLDHVITCWAVWDAELCRCRFSPKSSLIHHKLAKYFSVLYFINTVR
jgi:hypothetical protein